MVSKVISENNQNALQRGMRTQLRTTRKYNPYMYLNVRVFRSNTTPYPTTLGGCKPECHPSHRIQP